MRDNRRYELAQIRENEYVLADMVRRGEHPRGGLIAGVARRLRHRNSSAKG